MSCTDNTCVQNFYSARSSTTQTRMNDLATCLCGASACATDCAGSGC